MEDYLSQLNPAQRDAVQYLDGPQLVIAGAGSGKTRVLTYKIVHLLANGHQPWRIMALTFTNKAAREMRERIERLAGAETASKLWMGTFHSIFARILRINAHLIGYKSDYTIYDAADSRALIKTIIKDMNLDEKVYKPASVQSEISMAKNALMSPAAYAADGDIARMNHIARRDLMPQIYSAYCTRCRVAGAMDFDDLLYNTNVLLRDNPDVLRHYREYFSYVLVDEYQDTNFAQHLIVSQLTQGQGNLCVVGDDAQSIYSFRGANIRNILNLRNAYPGLQIFKLEQNYRSTQNIINAANSLISKNREQIPKNVFSVNDVGDRIEVVQSYSDFEEAYLVANSIAQLAMRTHSSYDEFAVLYRTNAQSRILEESLRKRNIPYRIYGGLSFYQRKEIKDAIAYFRLAVNPDDDEALRRVINFPARGIGDTTLGKLVAAAIEHRVSLWQVLSDPRGYDSTINAGTARKLEGFRSLIESFNSSAVTMAADELARHIISSTGMLAMYITETTPESISKQENLNELLSAVASFTETLTEEGEGDEATMSRFLAEASLATDQDRDDAVDEPKVTLMTIHAAKGLEFSNVFIVGVEEELLPSAMSLDSASGVEEERRLLYVAITRAKRHCIISYAKSRFINGQTKGSLPSRFISDIDMSYLYLATGTSIAGKVANPVENYRRSFHSSPTPAASRQPARQQSAPPSRPAAASAAAAMPAAGQFGTHSVDQLRQGMKISHHRFGQGVIASIDTSQPDARIVVRFSNTDTRTLLLKFAKFQIIEQ